MIVVANGDRIIASNDEELADTKVEDSRILQQIKANLSSAAVGHFKCDGSIYFGGLTAAAITISTPMYPTAW